MTSLPVLILPAKSHQCKPEQRKRFRNASDQTLYLVEKTRQKTPLNARQANQKITPSTPRHWMQRVDGE